MLEAALQTTRELDRQQSEQGDLCFITIELARNNDMQVKLVSFNEFRDELPQMDVSMPRRYRDLKLHKQADPLRNWSAIVYSPNNVDVDILFGVYKDSPSPNVW